MSEQYLAHHGIRGQKWGKKNGPPYPLDWTDHSTAEKKELTKDEIRAMTEDMDEVTNFNKRVAVYYDTKMEVNKSQAQYLDSKKTAGEKFKENLKNKLTSGIIDGLSKGASKAVETSINNITDELWKRAREQMDPEGEAMKAKTAELERKNALSKAQSEYDRYKKEKENKQANDVLSKLDLEDRLRKATQAKEDASYYREKELANRAREEAETKAKTQEALNKLAKAEYERDLISNDPSKFFGNDKNKSKGAPDSVSEDDVRRIAREIMDEL